ncbi:threonine synthase [Spirochaeta isovalerica]|uniref:Threonine synthase n=1 Tax=Spirochaeta isovalerica TaxID=150 RepID=A0A841RHV0_9SPIO|nr:threonine synthase [Spirochaeta isovalerica]MBB6482339.1 threonine synthase [Spirochaeta isovalerica]
MHFYSTRNSDDMVDFSTALFQGLAPDGGLYIPAEQADLSVIFSRFGNETSFTEIAGEMIFSLLRSTFNRSQSFDIAEKAFPFSPEITELQNNISILELFHGKSCAFKDFGASFLAQSMDTLLKKRERKAVILTATSGDTGSAVAQAFVGKNNIEVVILYPSGRVSPLQEKQLTTLGENIRALEVKGSFDDCQKMVKDAFVDKDITDKITLSSANSINLGRLIPQSFYYVWAYSRIKDHAPETVFTVPSGNFGNLTAGLYAQSWGLPISRFVAATNANDVVPKYLEDGFYNPMASVHTISNAMDVGAPSNYERMFHLFKGKVENFRNKISAYRVDDTTTEDTIKEVYEKEKYIMCPHTAVGYKAARLFQKDNGDQPLMVLSTAHPGKFTEVIEKVISVKPELPEELRKLERREKVSVIIENTSESLKDFLLTTY